jgi:hypothetical protein
VIRLIEFPSTTEESFLHIEDTANNCTNANEDTPDHEKALSVVLGVFHERPSHPELKQFEVGTVGVLSSDVF